MFPPPLDLDPRLEEAVEALEEAHPAKRVIAGRVYRVPVARLRARVAIQQPRRFNILEEFILRAAGELSPPPAPPELAALLGLDLLFIESTLSRLENLKAISRGPNAAITLTAQGKQFAAQGQVLQPPEHRSLSFVYRAGVDDLSLTDAASPPTTAEAELPVLPGLAADARERLTAQAQAAVKLKRVIAAVEAAGLELHRPADGRLLTTVDQVTVDDIGFAPLGILVVQDAHTEQSSLHVVDVSQNAPSPALQAVLDAWIASGSLKLSDFLPAAPPASLTPDPDAPDYAARYREALAAHAADDSQPLEVELLRASTAAVRARQAVKSVRHTVLLLYPRLTDPSSAEALRAELQPLAVRGVVAVVGWGAADDPDQEREVVAPGSLAALHALHDSDGVPCAAVWWLGGLYGQDAVFDQRLLVSSLPSRGVSSTYLITHPDLVTVALDDLEPSFARAARSAWQTAAQSPDARRAVLVRCCLTWVAVRRPGEALSHLLKLAAALAENEEPNAMLIAWECLAALCLALGSSADSPAGEVDDTLGQFALGAADLRRAVPEFLDWSDSVLPPSAGNVPPFVAALRRLLEEHGVVEAGNLRGLLVETRRLWRAHGGPQSGQAFSEVFTPALEKESLARGARPKPRR